MAGRVQVSPGPEVVLRLQEATDLASGFVVIFLGVDAADLKVPATEQSDRVDRTLVVAG